MTPEWREYLNSVDANIEADQVINFGNSQAELEATDSQGLILCDLSHFRMIAVTGEDAADFLNNQTCNDVNELTDHSTQLTAACNPKGRILFSFRLIRQADRYLIRLPGELADTAIKRLGMFVLRSKVDLTDISDELVRFGYWGNDAENRLCAELQINPIEINQVIDLGGITIMRIPGTRPRYEIFGELGQIKSLWETLAKDAQRCGASAWALLDIQAGIPTVFAATQDSFIPQMLNFQRIDGMSFTKGCYPGQEVIARMHYLGKIKRSMHRGRIDTKEHPQPGDELVAKDSGSGQWSGKIVDAQPSPRGGYELLAVALNEVVESGELHLGDESGPVFQVLPLPYTLENS